MQNYSKVSILLVFAGIAFFSFGYFIFSAGSVCGAANYCVPNHSYNEFYSIGAIAFLASFLLYALGEIAQKETKLDTEDAESLSWPGDTILENA